MTIPFSGMCLNQILLWIFFLLQIIDPICNKFVFQNLKLRKKKKKKVKEGDEQYSKLNDRMTIKFKKKKKKKKKNIP